MLVWTEVGKGRLTVRGRPGRSFWQTLPETKATHLLTLLSEREGAQGIGLQAQKVGLKWTWLAMPNGNPPEGDVLERIRLILPGVVTALQEGDSVVVHCAAGIHRAGMIAYLLLRLSGFTAETDVDDHPSGNRGGGWRKAPPMG